MLYLSVIVIILIATVFMVSIGDRLNLCLLYTSDAADE